MTGPGDMVAKMGTMSLQDAMSQLSVSTENNGNSNSNPSRGSLTSSNSSGNLKNRSPLSPSRSPKIRTANVNGMSTRYVSWDTFAFADTTVLTFFDMPDDDESPIMDGSFRFSYPHIQGKGKGREGEPPSDSSRPSSPSVSPVPRINEPRLPRLDMSTLPPRPPVPIVREPTPSRSLSAAMNEVESSVNMPPISAVQSQAPKLPVPLFMQRRMSVRPNPRESVLSLGSEQELQSFAEIMNMNLQDDGSVAENKESFGIPLDDEDAIIDDILSFEDVLQGVDRTKLQGQQQQRFSYGSTNSSSNYAPSARYIVNSPSDIEHEEFLDSYLSPNQSYSNGLHLHNLPRRPFQGSDSDTPSLRSSASTSSMSSPTLSRPPSFQHFYPTSPMSTSSNSSIMTPVDPMSGGMHGLGVIQERQHSEDVDGYHVTPRDSDMKKPPVPVRNVYEEEPVDQHYQQNQHAPSSWNYRQPPVTQMHQNQSHSNQSYSSQGHPARSLSPQGHSNQSYFPQDHHSQSHPYQTQPHQTYSHQQHYAHQPQYYQHIPEDRELREVRSYPDFDQRRLRAGSPETIIGQPISAYNSAHNSMSSQGSGGSTRSYHSQNAVPREQREPHQYYQHQHRDSQVSQWSQSSSQNSENTQQVLTRKASTPSLKEGNGGNAFSRLFKQKKTSTPALSSSGSSDARSVNTTLHSEVPNSPHSSNSDVSLNKSDLKKMKKDAAKARRERLAIDLKERQEAREKAAAEAKKAAKIAKPTETAGMWNGLSPGTVTL